MRVRITNEILYDIADLADNIEENFGSQYADVFEQEMKETQERNWRKILRTETDYTY